MKMIWRLTALALCLLDRGVRIRRSGTDRGDVPGWVMVTVMSAGLVVVIFSVFRGKIVDAISNAIDSVSGNTK